jgi:hypothetical protein
MYTMEYPPRWQPLAAETIDGTNRLLHRSSDGSLVYELHLSDDWSALVASGEPISIAPVEPGRQAEIWVIEVGYEVDLDQDDQTGPPLR